jgi:hypothetical protein
MSSKRIRPLRFIPICCTVAGVLAPTLATTTFLAAPALAGSGLVVIPRAVSRPALSYFKLQAEPGSAQSAGAVELRNPTGRRLRVALSAVDGETLSTLGSGYASPGSHAHGSTRWLTLGAHTVSLPPRTSVSVPVSVAVPPATLPGDYLSGVSVEALEQRAQGLTGRGVSIASLARYAIGVEVSLPGPRHPSIRFTGAEIRRQPAGLTFLLIARNAGDTILPGVHGAALITRAGRTVASQRIAAGTFVTHSTIAYPITAFRQTPPQGTRYRISAWMSYPGGIARLNTSLTFGHRQAVIQQQYAPRSSRAHAAGTAWWMLASMVAVILYALTATILLLRRRSREPRQAAVR